PDLGVVVPAAECHGDEAHARLDEPAREQRALPEGRAAVAVADAVAFLLDRERPAGLAGETHGLGPAAELVIGCDLAVAVDCSGERVTRVEQPVAAPHALRRLRVAAADVLDAEARGIRVASLERFVTPAEEGTLAEFPGERRVPRHGDVGRQRPA